jgi:hypothetical protein
MSYASAVDTILRFNGGEKRDPTIEGWLKGPPNERGDLVRPWFAKMRACGEDVRELMHDGFPTVCVEDAPFAYVSIFKAHANVGFYYGAELNDPARLLEGNGKRMRHVKLKPGHAVDAAALAALVDDAYLHIKLLLRAA